MAERYFYLRSKDKITGPFPYSQLTRFLEKRLITPDMLVSENRISWYPLAEVIDTATQEYPTIHLAPETDDTFCPDTNVNAMNTQTASSQINESESANPDETDADSPAAADNLQLAPEPPPGKEQIDTPFCEPKQTIFPVLPDPICATFCLCWNARNSLEKLQQMQKHSEEENTVSADRNILFSYGTVFALVILLFFATFLCTFIMTPAYCAALLGTAGILFLCGALLLFLENLFLAMIVKLEKIMSPFFLAMQYLCISVVIFVTGLPLFALYLAGPRNCPEWLVYIIFIFSGCSLLGEGFNLTWGYVFGCRNIFKISKIATSILALLFTVQWLVIFPAGFWIFGLIQKNNLF